MADPKIYQQIETLADLYQPAVYELLSFYHGMTTVSDAMEGQFIPLTSVQSRSPKDVKIFAVGIIPPSSRVTGKLLDRTATLSTIPEDYQQLVNVFPDDGSSSTGDLPGQTSGIGTSLPAPVGPTATSSDDFWVQYIAMCNRLGVQAEELAKVIQSESGFDPHAVAIRNDRPVAKGLIQFTRATAEGLTAADGSKLDFDTIQDMSREDQLKFVEAYYKGRARGKSSVQLKAITFGGFNNPRTSVEPAGSIYSSNAVPPEYKNPEFQKKAYLQNINLDAPPPRKGYITADDLAKAISSKSLSSSTTANIQRAKAGLGMSTESPVVKEPDPPKTDSWQDEGSDNASEYSKTASLVANKDLNQTHLGKRFQEAQKATIRAMQAALETMANTPPLRLLVNPASFRVSSEKIISDGSWGRNGPIVEHWGETQDKIEGSGKIAAFYSMDINDANGPGLTRTARQFSTSYQNLLSLWLLYKNNGGVWFPDPIDKSSTKKNLSVVGSVYLYYDDILYVGSFDSFNLTESETAPFTLEYSFSFTVRAWYLLDHLDDSQYTYGPPVTPVVQTGINAQTLGTGGNNAQVNPNVPLPTVSQQDDPLFGLDDDDIGDDLEGI